MSQSDKGRKNRKRITVAIVIAAVCVLATIGTYIVSNGNATKGDNANGTKNTQVSPSKNDAKENKATIDIGTNDASNASVASNANQAANANAGQASDGTTGDASLDKNITDAVSLIATCAGSTAAPDQSQADACNFEDASFFANDGDINYQYASDEVQAENIDNMVSLYRRAAQAYVVVPGIKTRTISQVHIVGKVSEDDGMPIYEAKMLCQETRDDGTSGGQWYDVLISVNPDDGKIIAIRETRTDSE